MALFDSIISGAAEKFGLGDKAGTLLSALLALMTNQKTGGFGGFISSFKDAGLGDMATSWVSGGDNADISDDQVASVLGNDVVGDIAKQAGLSEGAATSALGYMLPQVIDKLTPDGDIPDDESLLSKIGGFLSGIGGTAAGAVVGAAGAAGAVASGAADAAGDAAEAVGDAAGAAVDKGKEVVGDAAGAVGDAAGAVSDKVGDTFESVGDAFDDDGDGSILKWLLPLLLLGLLLLLGFWFCSGNKGTVKPANSNTNSTNTNGATATDGEVESSVNIEAKDGKYTITGVVKDQATKDKILAEAEKTWGKDNVDVEGLKIDANAKPFADGWWDNFTKLLPDLKDWKDGAIGWTGNALKTIGEVPGAIADKLKSLFGGWTLGGTLGGAADAVKDAAKSVTDTVTDAARKLSEVTLGDTKLEAYPGGIEDQLIKFIDSDEYKNATAESLKDKWFDFDDLNFKFGTKELEPSSKRQLDNIVAILKANPDVKIKIGGYTDKTDDDAKNKTLSDSRANAVKAELAKAGVGAQVPEAEGYGEQFAKVAEDASDEERASDRKTSIRLLK